MRAHSLLALCILAATGSSGCSEARDRRAADERNASSARPGKPKTPAKTSGNRNAARIKNARLDVIVVGAGISGLTAALELGRSGARVLVIDMSSVFGGHAVMSQGGVSIVGTPAQTTAGIKDSPDLAYRDFTHF
ncbi:MAG: FAD-dependent oxidoreductase [Planctomycetaceae bacterium]